MIATFDGGIIIIIIPLLALTMDQMVKIEEVLQDSGAVSAVHLDKFSKAAINGEVILCMHKIRHDSESIMFIFPFLENSRHSCYA